MFFVFFFVKSVVNVAQTISNISCARRHLLPPIPIPLSLSLYTKQSKHERPTQTSIIIIQKDDDDDGNKNHKECTRCSRDLGAGARARPWAPSYWISALASESDPSLSVQHQITHRICSMRTVSCTCACVRVYISIEFNWFRLTFLVNWFGISLRIELKSDCCVAWGLFFCSIVFAMTVYLNDLLDSFCWCRRNADLRSFWSNRAAT